MDLLDEVTLAIIDIYDDVEEIGVSRGQAKLMLRRAVETAAAVLDELDEEEAETIVSISDSNALLAKALRKGP